MYLMVAGGILFTLEVLVLLALLPCAYDGHRRLRSVYLSSHPSKNYPSATEGTFGFSWIMLSTDAKIRACFTSFLAARAPSRKADFSTLKCQLLTVRLSQDLVSIDIFESDSHSDSQ